MNVLILGGSKNIGYYAAQRLLESGSTVTFLLRRGNVFDSDSSLSPYIASGTARIVEGDALNEADVRRSWEQAADGGAKPVDVVLFTIGAPPKFALTRGFVVDPPDICTRTMINLLVTFPTTQSPPPKLIMISSSGVTRASHAALPLVVKPFYGFFLKGPHEDKLGMERAAAHAAGWTWGDGEPSQRILPSGWQSRVGERGVAKEVVVLRPSAFTDGECTAGKAKSYRAADNDLKGAYTISRRDVAHFIVERCLKEWGTWRGKYVSLAY